MYRCLYCDATFSGFSKFRRHHLLSHSPDRMRVRYEGKVSRQSKKSKVCKIYIPQGILRRIGIDRPSRYTIVVGQPSFLVVRLYQ